MNAPAPAWLIRRLLWLNIGIHLAALGFAALAMRPGTPAIPLEERMRFLASSPLGWTLGWGLWTACAVIDFAFLAIDGRLVIASCAGPFRAQGDALLEADLDTRCHHPRAARSPRPRGS